MILAILQARTSSTRLPGKVLKLILGKPMMLYQIERVKRAKKIDKLIVATSIDKSNDPIAKLCAINNIECFRGSLNDVLDRFYCAASLYNPDHIVRSTADCPLIDPQVIDRLIELHLSADNDYSSLGPNSTFPHGLDVEIVKTSILNLVWRETYLPAHREHVTQFIYQNPDRFKLGRIEQEVNLSNFRWTVDYPEDFDFVDAVYKALYLYNPNFSMHDIVKLLAEQPALRMINYSHHEDTRNRNIEMSKIVSIKAKNNRDS